MTADAFISKGTYSIYH